ncbi:MAG: DNA polymerase I [Deltaproteobacteria bacterium]|nr:DNA polymerase I [Deltaproteobacteria bacterium]
MTETRKIYLVDGSGYIFRAFYAIHALRTKDGFPTNALYGFTRMLLRLLHESDSQHVAVVFDAGRETFRTEIYKEYKANRSECPPDLLKQMPFFAEIATALGLPVLMQPGYEADDIIGTLAERLSNAGVECVIVSGDKDLMQLVGDQVSVWDTMKDARYDADGVKNKLGVWPNQVTDYLGLTGDSSDNVPGLQGVGPKTAIQLIERYGGVEEILNNAEKIGQDTEIRNRKKLASLIESEAECVRLSKRLVEIKRDVPLEIHREAPGVTGKIGQQSLALSDAASGSVLAGNPAIAIERPASLDGAGLNGIELYEALLRHEPDQKSLNQLIDKFEFGSLVKDFRVSIERPSPDKKAKESYRTVFSNQFEGWLADFFRQNKFAFDIETTSLDVFEAAIVGISICWSDSEAYYIPIGHRPEACNERQVELQQFIKSCGERFSDPSVIKVGQNLKFDLQILANNGCHVAGVGFDTMVAAYLLNPDRRSYNLTALAHDYLDRGVIEYEEVAGSLPDFSYVPVTEAAQYACQDAHFAWLICAHLEKLLQEQQLARLMSDIEAPLVDVLARMELAGVKLDCGLLASLSHRFSDELERLKSQLHEMAGCEFNLNSPKQLSEILFTKLAISTKGVKKTKTGLSTDSSVLEKLALSHPFPGLLLRYRSLHKLKSTYVDVLPAQVSKRTGRLHTKFNQTQTGTGRLSSSEPNLQNIPIQTAEGRQIREAFIADEGKILISADYSQVELRILAHMSGDDNLIAAFSDNIDIHAKTAREIMGIDPGEEVSPEVRRIGKTINFGVIYGMGAFRLSKELEIPVTTASHYIESYFAKYPKVRELFSRLEEEAGSKGHVTTLFGRRRIIGDLDVSGRDQGFAMRAAINAPIQGTAADIIKLAMIKLDRVIRERGLGLRMLLQIHDELLFEADQAIGDEAELLIRNTMEGVVALAVPLQVDIGRGPNWQVAHS